jgi:hypothetical protein
MDVNGNKRSKVQNWLKGYQHTSDIPNNIIHNQTGHGYLGYLNSGVLKVLR